MAVSLSNGAFTKINKAIDQLIRSMHDEGNDQYKEGIWRMRSRVKYNDSYYNIMNVNSSSINYCDVNTGKITMLTSVDLASDNRINPLCDFKTGTFNETGLTGWCGHIRVADTSDSKAGRIYITTEESADSDLYSNQKTIIFDAGKAIGTCKNIIQTVDVRADIKSGICLFQEYALDLDDSNVPLTLYGFHGGIDGLTGEYEVLLSNDTSHCKAIKNIKTGKLTYLETTDARYNLVPSNFTQAVTIGECIYYIGCDGYIYKIDASTFELIKKSSWYVNNKNMNGLKDGLFTDGTNLYLSQISTSTSGTGYYMIISMETLDKGSATSIENINIPEYLLYKGNSGYIRICSVDNGTKFVLHNAYYGIAVVFTDLTNVGDSILEDYTQLLVGGDSFALTSEGLFSYWIYLNEGISGNSMYDLGSPYANTLKVCKSTSGQVFALAEWSEAYENTGAKQLTLTMYDTYE